MPEPIFNSKEFKIELTRAKRIEIEKLVLLVNNLMRIKHEAEENGITWAWINTMICYHDLRRVYLFQQSPFPFTVRKGKYISGPYAETGQLLAEYRIAGYSYLLHQEHKWIDSPARVIERSKSKLPHLGMFWIGQEGILVLLASFLQSIDEIWIMLQR